MHNCNRECDAMRTLIAQQSEILQNISVIINKLDDTQQMVECNAFDIINSSDTSLNLVKDGVEHVGSLLDKVTILSNYLQNSAMTIQNITSISEIISNFAKVIGGLSNKTHILAINASLANARAGKNLDDFATITNEIRNLAEQSSVTSVDIAEAIQEIFVFVNELVQKVNLVSNVVKEQNEQVQDIQGILEKILDAAYASNEVAHIVEYDVAKQRDITESVKLVIENIFEEDNSKIEI